MKQLRLVALVFAAAAWTSVAAFACDMGGGASAAAGSKSSCGSHATTTASAAAASACPATASCPMGSSQCTAAMRAKCTADMRSHGAKGSKATVAAASTDCCAGKGTSATAAVATKGAGCCARNAIIATATGRCDMKAGMHGDCSVCMDEATCANDLRVAGVRSHVMPLRNGAMIEYSADNAEGVRVLQATVARHNERIMSAYASGSEATLCGECKAFRGAMASGKFSRELVNVKNGCQIVLTSSDRNIVRKIHDMTGAQVAARVRS